MSEQFITTNGIRLHYLDSGGSRPLLLLFHGLTANAHAFDGLFAAGLGDRFRVISVDLRGRGLSDAPADDYSMAAHARDIIGLMDALELRPLAVGGHSFGALLTLYLAAHYPARVRKLVLMDAAARMHPQTKEMLAPALGRLGQTFASFDAYLERVQQAPYLHFWDAAMRSYYAADVRTLEDGQVIPIPQPTHMVHAVTGALAEPWLDYLKSIPQPALLINGPGIYTMNAALLPEELALETVGLMKNCSYANVPGNHQTMLYGEGAAAIVASINEFLYE